MLTPAPERFWSKVAVGEPDECWPWLGILDRSGYGRFPVASKLVQAHRFVYALERGPIPEGLQIDHLCHDPALCEGGVRCPHRACANPAHMEPVTFLENVRRGASPSAQNGRKTHCSQGHPFDEFNTYLEPQGGRVCRACNRAAVARYQAKRRSEVGR